MKNENRLTLKEFYIFEEKHNGVLYEIHDAIAGHDWNNARELIEIARHEYKIPEGTIQEAVISAFNSHKSKLKEAQSYILGN